MAIVIIHKGKLPESNKKQYVATCSYCHGQFRFADGDLEILKMGARQFVSCQTEGCVEKAEVEEYAVRSEEVLSGGGVSQDYKQFSPSPEKNFRG